LRRKNFEKLNALSPKSFWLHLLKSKPDFLNPLADGCSNPGPLRGFPPLITDPCRFSKDMAMQTENRKDFDLDRLLHPAGAFRTPMEVVKDPDMTIQEKRAILASWASDACAVEASPDLRQPPSAPTIRFDDIMDALKRLDGEAADKPVYGKFINRARRWKDLYRSDRGERPLVA
jgi:hypothetical protein